MCAKATLQFLAFCALHAFVFIRMAFGLVIASIISILVRLIALVVRIIAVLFTAVFLYIAR